MNCEISVNSLIDKDISEYIPIYERLLEKTFRILNINKDAIMSVTFVDKDFIHNLDTNRLAYNNSIKREICFLFVHGLLHLLGYDHMTKEDEEIMFPLQEQILEGELN